MAQVPVETTDLVVLDAAARLGSFSAAAAELQLSAPSVSNRLAAVERAGARTVSAATPT
ncbi:LysR family transcriptional regulator, partial [Amycolatopsis sp. NPDC000740]|uniref:helix-turn-helix domain-containing protein n=1 Tax=Amycolatopsis sp. NPDC000740 TaxID=3154269 RepID=UPI003331855B